MTVFIDSNILVAGVIPGEGRHKDARRILAAVAAESPFTSDHALVEAWHIIHTRAGYFHASRFWFGIRETPLSIECVTAIDLERAESIARDWRDQEFDMVDCTSFAVMERMGCSRAATFDRDFAVYRFGAQRTKAFEILS
ncbi:MAG: PIN domain-containing protein [Dehalococcoidia bacterium]